MAQTHTCTSIYILYIVHVLMRDEKEERSKHVHVHVQCTYSLQMNYNLYENACKPTVYRLKGQETAKYTLYVKTLALSHLY